MLPPRLAALRAQLERLLAGASPTTRQSERALLEELQRLDRNTDFRRILTAERFEEKAFGGGEGYCSCCGKSL